MKHMKRILSFLSVLAFQPHSIHRLITETGTSEVYSVPPTFLPVWDPVVTVSRALAKKL